MSKDEMSFEELTNLEGRLRRAEATGTEEESLARVLRKVQAHVNTTPAPASRRWGRRLSMFAVVGIPAAAAALIAAILLNLNPQRGIVPTPNSTPSVEPSVAPSASPVPPAEPLVVLTQRVVGALSNGSLDQAPDTVLLVRLDGTIVAKATFKPAQTPLFTNAATILPPQVHAAAAAAFYIDGDGVVRRLDRDGRVSVVASFPTGQPQHMTAFAVKPDGSEVMATMFTFGPPATPSNFPPQSTGPSFDDLYVAPAGGSTTRLSHAALSNTVGHFMVLGWDGTGPLAGTSVPIATQNLIPNGWNSPVYHLDAAGNMVDRLGGTGCVAEFISGSGQLLCSSGPYAAPPVDVRLADGTIAWKLPSGAAPWDFAALSPAGDALAARPINPGTLRNGVFFKDGSIAPLPANVFAAGWMDDQTLAAYQGDLNSYSLVILAGVRPGHVGNPTTFPVKGIFAGAIH